MLKKKDLFDEISNLEKIFEEEKNVEKGFYKGFRLVLKMLYDIRLNQVRMMEKIGVKKITNSDGNNSIEKQN